MSQFERIKRLPPYVFSIVTDLKMKARRAGEDIIDLGMGNPDMGTPPHVVSKLIEAAHNPRNHRYSASKGIQQLRLAICEWYKRNHDVDLDPESEAIVTMGAKEG
jgi:alanine-synthesizing transaminase